VVLGFNSADDKKIAIDFMIENGVTYPNILDSSDEANRAIYQYETMGMSAVPMTYVIDKEGKIAEAWYGYGGSQQHGIDILKRLGIDTSTEIESNPAKN
jgi:peroxiredoxin